MRVLRDLFDANGVNANKLFSDSGIYIPNSTDFNVRVPTEAVSRLWELAVEVSGDPGIALKLKPKRPLPSFDALGYAMLSSPSLISGLERFSRYLSVVSSAAESCIEIRGDRIALYFHLHGGTQPIPRQRYEFDMLCLLEFFRWMMNSDLDPVVVELGQPRPANLKPYEKAFACEVDFQAEHYCLLFSMEQALRPVPTFNSELVSLHDSYLNECMGRLKGNSTANLIRERIVHTLPEGEPQRAKIAHALHMSERTLQRHLVAEGTSFSEILDDVRRELSVKYLNQCHLELIDISCLLGFNGQSNFSRAFKRWFNTSPRKYREALNCSESPRV